MLVVQRIPIGVTAFTSEGSCAFTGSQRMVADIYCLRHTQSIGTTTKVYHGELGNDYLKNDCAAGVETYVLAIDRGHG